MTSTHHRPLTAEDLLASPRGRSLVFGLALSGREDEFDDEGQPLTASARALDEFRNAVFIAGYLADKAQGAAVAMYLGEGDSEPAPGAVTAGDVAEKLRFVTPSKPSQAELEHTMAEVIGGAMYWQPPHGADHIAAGPEVCEALRPFAEELIGTGLLDAWSRPLDTENQWALAWDDEEHRGGLPAVFTHPTGPIDQAESRPAISLADLFSPADGDGDRLPWGFDAWLGHVLTTETEYRHDLVKDPNDEVSGEWRSTPPKGLWTSTSTWPDQTPIGVELVEDDFGLERARACRLRLRPEAHIAEICWPEDWAQLCRRFPLDVTAQRRYVWSETTGRKGRWVIPDWPRVAEEFDGVHVSLAGYLRTAGSVVEVGDHSLVETSPSLPTIGNTDDATVSLMAGWHPDMTFWLNDVVDTVTEVVEWVYDNDADAWRRTPTQ
ncbi:hypothetical protein AAFP32_02645 [Brevibacterium sp. CBA3109]|uniref:Uncharacterized protein n=1 Tax=Brevibacterium koreense TaxID=3140787 RepID=A0AAU7UNE3_9MICO